MIKKLLFGIFAILTITATKAQITANFSLDNWANQGSYEEPTNGWTTLNELRNLSQFNPITTTKTTDKHSGTFAAKMETGKIQFANTIIGGVLATGFFDNNANPGENLKLGQPFTSSPIKLSLYYKYTSVSNDSAAIFCALTKWNSGTNSRDTLGTVAYIENNTIGTYTLLDLPIVYSDSVSTPDTLILLFSSSAEAANFQGQEGSTLFVDEIAMETPAGVKELLSNEIDLVIYPNPTTNFISVNTNSDNLYTATIFNMLGETVETFTIAQTKNISVNKYAKGDYILSIKDNKGLVATKRFTKQ